MTAPTCVQNRAGIVYALAVDIPDVQPLQAVTLGVRRATPGPRDDTHECVRAVTQPSHLPLFIFASSHAQRVAHRAAAAPSRRVSSYRKRPCWLPLK